MNVVNKARCSSDSLAAELFSLFERRWECWGRLLDEKMERILFRIIETAPALVVKGGGPFGV
ncbi:MAG: hypothetical protein AB8G99_16125, partial [Planctomycetaceae bacterium]